MKKLIAALLVLSILLFSGCSLPVINLSRGISTPQDDFSAFINSLNAGDYQNSSGYLYNYASLGFSSFDDEPVYQHLLECLNSSRTYSVKGCRINGHDAVIEIELSTLDFRKLSDTLSSQTLDRIDEEQYMTGVAMNDEEIEEMMNETLDAIMQSPDEYCTVQDFTLSMHYSEGKWKLICTDAFYSALIGYIV